MGGVLKKLGLINQAMEMFCQYMAKDGTSPTKCALEAGYSKSSAASKACHLLKDPRIKKRLKELQDERIAKFEVTHEYLTENLKAIAETNILDFGEFLDGRFVIKDFTLFQPENHHLGKLIRSFKTNKKGLYEVVFWDKSFAMDMLAKHKGYYEADNSQKTIENPIQIYIPDNGRDTQVT